MAKILVIEDDDIIRKLIVRILSQENFEVLESPEGESGLKVAAEEKPHLIICDVMMPKVNGYQVLERLQQDTTTKTIPFIFLTAKAEKSDMRQGMQLGADDYLTKPFTKDELVGAVHSRLKKFSTFKNVYNDELQKTQEHLRKLLLQDSITNLPNQLSLRDQFQLILKDTQGRLLNQDSGEDIDGQGFIIPVFCVSLDRFHRINETLGYEIGNLLLKAVAERLLKIIGDQGTAIRLNSDEFCIVLKGMPGKPAVMSFAQNLIDQFALPFQIQHQDIFSTLSLGISLYPRDDQDVGRLLQQANKAMTRTKQSGGNQYQFYTAAYNIGKSNLVSLETDLRYALDRREFEVYYQPQINLRSGQLTGVEALLRWYHPLRGSVSPNQFIPLAEETGLIEPIGEWVMAEACRQIKIWQDSGLPALRIAVNLSARQFNQLNLHQRLGRILMDNNLDPQFLELELTEGTLVQNAEIAMRRLTALKTLGVRIAIDDFGTGYSSLSYLQQFPFDVIKIDRSFVHNIHKNTANTAIVSAIISMAHDLGLKVIAEGVESQDELDFLAERNCDEIQGYLYSYPVSAQELEQSPFFASAFEAF